MPTLPAPVAAPQRLKPTAVTDKIQPLLRRKPLRRRAVRIGLITLHVLVVVAIGAFVLERPQADASGAQTSVVADASGASAAANPLDQLSSADIALTVARMNGLPETTAVANQAQTQAADLTTAASSDTTSGVISEPQVVTTALKSRADIQTYMTQPGDTIASIAAKFGITSDSLLWSNNLRSTTVNPGTKLTIPPVNGVVYIVKAGDTPASLAVRFNASEAQIIAYNDAEIDGLKPGEQVIIPSGTEPAAYSGGAYSGTANVGGFPWGSGPVYGSNGYDFGYCTWYVASQIAVPNNWGNAATWAYYASLSGWNVSTTPTVGSIAQTALAAAGEGHVAIVTGVNADGTVTIHEMNDAGAPGGGWDRMDTTTRPISAFQHYITP